MSITVHDCLKLPSLRSGRLIAGKSGLDGIVSTVSVVEIPEDIQTIQVFNPNALCISAMYSIKDSVEEQCFAVKSLAESGVVALVMFYVGYIVEELGEELIRTADKLSMPLIIIEDQEIKYSDVITDVMTAVVQDQLVTKDFVATTKNRLQQIPESKRDMENLLKIVSSSFKCNLLLYNNTGLYFTSVYRPSYGIFDADYYLNVFRNEPQEYAYRKVSRHGNVYHLFKMDFSHEGNSWFTLFASCSAGQLNESIMKDLCSCINYFSGLWGYSLDMQSTKTIISLILKSSKVTAEKFLKSSGIQISDISNLIIFSADADLTGLESKIRNIFKEYNKFAISDIIDEKLVVLTSLSLSDKMDSLLVQDLREITNEKEKSISFFLDSESRDVSALHRVYSDFCANAHAMDKIFRYRKYRDMHDVLFTEEVARLEQTRTPRSAQIQSVIQLLQEDSDHLLETLAVYLIDCDAQLNLTSETLFLHRNTVSYRLNKIKRLSNTDFTKMPATYDYYIAAAIWRLHQS